MDTLPMLNRIQHTADDNELVMLIGTYKGVQVTYVSGISILANGTIDFIPSADRSPSISLLNILNCLSMDGVSQFTINGGEGTLIAFTFVKGSTCHSTWYSRHGQPMAIELDGSDRLEAIAIPVLAEFSRSGKSGSNTYLSLDQICRQYGLDSEAAGAIWLALHRKDEILPLEVGDLVNDEALVDELEDSPTVTA